MKKLEINNHIKGSVLVEGSFVLNMDFDENELIDGYYIETLYVDEDIYQDYLNSDMRGEIDEDDLIVNGNLYVKNLYIKQYNQFN